MAIAAWLLVNRVNVVGWGKPSSLKSVQNHKSCFVACCYELWDLSMDLLVYTSCISHVCYLCLMYDLMTSS
jgi:hypothetical protein